MEKRNPFDIPEILYIIASFISVWEEEEPRNGANIKRFMPRDLLACTLVNRLWRQEMLPHLWAVYSPEHMTKIPIDLIIQNCVHFRHFDPGSETRHFRLVPIPPKLWQRDSSGQLLLQKCAALKTFVLTPQALENQFEILRANHSLVFLDWMWCTPRDSEMRDTIQSMVKSFSWSLKELCLRQGDITLQDLVSLLRNFPRLERLVLEATCQPLLGSMLTEMAGTDGVVVRIDTLKHLTIFNQRFQNDGMLGQNNLRALLSIFDQCLNIEHVVVDYYGPARRILGDFQHCREVFLAIQGSVSTWSRSRQLKEESNTSMPTDNSTGGTSTSSSLVPTSQMLHRGGVETLEIHHRHGNNDEPCHVQFRRGCQDLVMLTAFVQKNNAYVVVVELIRSFRRSLQQLNLICKKEVLGHILGGLTKLQSLKFDAGKCKATMEETIMIFQGEFGQLEDQDSESALTETSGTSTTGWACQHLKHLSLSGLNLIDKYDDRMEDIHPAVVTLEAASENHQWVSKRPAMIDEDVRTIISARIKTLPELKELALGNVSFAYTRIESPNIK
ncbi:hypothetical protein BGZ93_003521 [Podila epicladia]|nr:hypothetical protein BGZ92_007400 [Podila epicladia]KAG0097036.1 hypothetical protein BGZ93_003521 [Podila epicladia]